MIRTIALSFGAGVFVTLALLSLAIFREGDRWVWETRR